MSHVPQLLPCDGCGQLADSQHIAVRLQRLEWATRFRPIHMQALLVSGVAPVSNDEFLYDPAGQFQGEARRILDAVRIPTAGKKADEVLAEFQRLGLMLVHVLECPLSTAQSPLQLRPLLEYQLAATVRRIRRSLKPKRVLLLFSDLQPVADKLLPAELGCPVHPATGGVFLPGATASYAELQDLRAALAVPYVQTA